jgi:hypothetical protein
MFLVQILLPLYDADHEPRPRAAFALVANELLERFGGMTAYVNAPARGVWEDDRGRAEHDDIIVHEVMTETLEKSWWTSYRKLLESRFAQDQIVIRALAIQRM